MNVAAVGTALPQHRYAQQEIRATVCALWQDRPDALRRLESVHEHVSVRERFLALPLERYLQLASFTECNDEYIAAAVRLGERAIGEALARAGLDAGDVDALFAVSVTGVTSPSLDARLCNVLPFRSDVKRTPLWGLGCVGGAAGLARAADYVRGHPRDVAVLLAVELCSLTLQKDDLSARNVIATGLFGDGAAAVVLAGAERGMRGPRVVATQSVFYPDTQSLMGWEVGAHGFRIVLSPGLPAFVRGRIGADVDAFLQRHGLGRADVGRWICHPGGPKVLRAVQDALALDDRDVALAWEVLAAQGNLSSASVLMVLERVLQAPPPAGTHAVLLALGPGFCAELVLLRF
jgi:alkylresorcinol/alkylpyrone synthase